MGGGMAQRLLATGHEVVVYDLSREAANAVLALGAQWRESSRELASDVEVVLTSMPGPKEVEAAFFQPESGILAGLSRGQCFIDTTTNSPRLIRRIGAACAEKGAGILDAPVSRGAGGPDSGQMSIMIGGEKATFERYQSLLSDLGTNVYYMGELGNGMEAKAINQFLICAGFLAGAEALLIGAKAGLDITTLREALSTSAGGRIVNLDSFTRTVFPRSFSTAGAGGPVTRWIKDVSCAAEVAEDAGAPTAILPQVLNMLKTAEAQGWGDDTWYSAVRVLEQAAGVELTA
jgi:3-hydroxyisobutyrate dehydrogenase-like beta-hydroxyacid dehydrogenase